jgi:cobalt-zinc-cadmium efflux system outer membrane protein
MSFQSHCRAAGLNGRLCAILLMVQVVASSAHAQPAELTLENYVSQVVSANPALAAAEQRSEALNSLIKPAATLDDPFVAFGVDEIPFGEQNVQMYRYQASQSFPFPGKLRARAAVATQRAKAGRYDAETLRRELVVVATQQFYRAWYNEQALLLNRALWDLVQSSMQSAKARYEAGGAEHHDWLLAKIELATLSVDRKKLQREQFSLHSLLNELRGRQPGDDLGPIAVTFSDDGSDHREMLLDDQPEMAALDAQAVQAEKEYELAKKSYYPDFVVQAMALQPRSPMNDDEESNWGLMVGVNLPIYSSRKQSNLVAAAQHQQHAVDMERQYLRNRLNTEIVNASQALASARDVLTLYEQDVLPDTEMAVANAASAYQARRVELARYLSVLKIHKTQQLEFVAARIDVELAKTRLREVLSSPPLMQLAPSRPTVFGGGDMGGAMQASDSVSMGRGISADKKIGKTSDTAGQDGKSGMGEM